MTLATSPTYNNGVNTYLSHPIVNRRPSNRRGFTLIELLTVVGIILVLMSILVPSLGKARVMVMRGVCKSQVGDLSAACKAYALENKEFGYPLPSVPEADTAGWDWANIETGNPAGLWLLVEGSFAPRRMFKCPEAGTRRGWKEPSDDDTAFTYNATSKISTLSYSYISMVDNSDPAEDEETFRNATSAMDQIASHLVILADDNPRYDFNSVNEQGGLAWTLTPDGTYNSENHKKDGQNVARLDGSAAWFTDAAGGESGGDNIYAADNAAADGKGARAEIDDSFCNP